MLDFRFWLTLIILGLGCASAPAQAPGRKGSGPPALASGRTPDGVARWNNRTTPRKALETFYFAISGYDRSPDLIVNAIDCLDLGALDPEMRERDAALLAHQLEFILNRQAIPLYGVPDRPDGDRVVLAEVAGQPIELARQPDGRWRFDSETVGRIGRLRQLASAGERVAQERRAAMADGRTDPSATMRSFAGAAMGRRDFAMAAQCLDLRYVPPKLRASEGAQLARKLAFVMQRCGFMFTQEIPNEPDGYRYVWHSNHRGRIMLERIRLPEGRDAWLFSRGTLRNLDALVEGHRATPPDPRYATIGLVIGEDVLAAGKNTRVPPPPGVPAELGSPRKALRAFLDSMDELEFDADRSQTLLACLDLDAIPPGDREGIGLRLAAKLEAVLRRVGVDLMTIADTWEADPVVFGRDTEWQVTLARGKDGAWRFDRETVSRVPDMFERLTPDEKSVRERRSSFHSPQQTMRTLLHASDAGDLALAARCLDLDGVPQGARAELGPILAYKLKFVLDRIGRVVLEEIPSEADGPRFYYHRSTLGRIDLARSTEGIRRGDWLFSRETVGQIEAMYRGAFHRRLSPELSPDKGVRAGPSLGLVPSLWLRARMPAWLRKPALGLDVYQWSGLIVAIAGCGIASWLGLRVLERIACFALHRGGLALDRAVVGPKLRPLALQIGLWCLYLHVRLLDLPMAVVGAAIPAIKFAWIGLVGWMAFRLIDMGMIVYGRSERLHDRRSLSDMIVPTAANGLKLAVLLLALSCQVYLVGSRETLTQLLAGLGLIGLAASLAAQDTLKNFFGTLLLIGEHPFRIGEHIAVQGTEGVVEKVGFRSTRLRTFEDSLLTIPNSVMAAALIDNRAARRCRRFRAVVSLDCGAPIDKVVAMRDALRAFAKAQPRFIADKVEVHIVGLGANGVELLVQAYFRVAGISEELACCDLLSREILEQAGRLGIDVGLAGRTVHLASQGTGLHTVPPSPKFVVGRERSEAPRHGLPADGEPRGRGHS